MDVFEMHVLFRTLGQQNGLQQIRGILPESIDVYLNEANMTIVKSTIQSNALSINKDVRTPQYGKISPINAIRTLYVTEEQELNIEKENSKLYNEVSLNLQNKVLQFTNFAVKYNSSDEEYYDCRLIEPERLFNTNKDYLNRASQEYPIVALYKGDLKTTESIKLALCVGGKQNIKSLLVQYIKYPETIKFDEIKSKRANCDLPEYKHNEVVELAVRLWMNSLGLTSQHNQTNKDNE